MPYQLKKPVLSLLMGLTGLLFSVSAYAAEYSVEINKTEIMRLPGSAAAVVVGNPKIADITVHSSDTLLLNGRAYGETNIIVFDEFGQTVMNADVMVKPPQSNTGVRVNFVGEGRKSFTCSPFCMPSPVHGDSTQFQADFEGEELGGTNAITTGPTTNNPAPEGSFAPPQYEIQR